MTLASSAPSVAGTFTEVARRHLVKTRATHLPTADSLFVRTPDGDEWQPSEELSAVLARSRMLYGAGMGVGSLTVLTEVVRGTVGMRWEEDSRMEDALATVDADITQAIQSAQEEMEGGRIVDLDAARVVRGALFAALMESRKDVEGWQGDYPFERALASVQLWKL
ncbi:hypothetical protein BN946_scf184743.g7 [Trametes cinnabarina]|uniref:Uncharacterized protein n=1 Tax=Pycnoporus cinnabarinus TaxID=5643 RepID=A0A060SM89_PYCCI|nr:hypothetical protein BN946_scf184743.g7 [Trametes cinnabarina]